jgi:hemolysin III
MPDSATAPPPRRPLFRGWIHAAAAIASVVITALFVVAARGQAMRLSLLIFGLTMVILFSVSAVYHIPDWEPPMRGRLRALDHADIFLLIAGTYTAVCVNMLTGRLRLNVLAAVWTAGIIGVLTSCIRIPRARVVSAILYVAMGWIAIVLFPTMLHHLPLGAFVVLLSGGLSYTAGAIIYAAKWPDPLPRFFGYHEIFHLLTVAGCGSFVAVIWLWVIRR